MDIPDNAVQIDAQAPVQPQATQAPLNIPDDAVQLDSDKYGTISEQIKAGLEGAARGVAGPLATAYENKLMGVPAADILGRQKANPWTSGIGEAAGLGAGMLTGTGEAALMSKAAEAGVEGLGLVSKAGEAMGLGHKIGSAAVQQAIEMGILSGSDETSKLILQDPNTTSESAIANTGIGALTGAAFGAATGLISPLWSATAGPTVDKFLSGMTKRVNGESAIAVPSMVAKDLETLGIQPTAVQQASLSDNPTLAQWTKDLTRGENPQAIAEREAFKQNVANSIVEPLNTSLDDIRVYDNDEAGRNIADKINSQIKDTFEPLWERMDKRNEEAALISTPDDSKLKMMDRLRERGVMDYAPNSPQTKLFYDAGERILDFRTLADFDKYDTELRNEASKAFGAKDNEGGFAYKNIRDMLKDYKNSVISSSGKELENLGIEGAGKSAEELIAERNTLNKQYAIAESVREQLGDHFNIKSSNSRQFMKALSENMTPEQVLKKFSIKNNMEGANFLQQNFREAFKEVVLNERRALLKSAVNSSKDEMPINVNRLASILEKTRKGNDSYLKTILPEDFINRAEAGSRVLESITTPKDTGTPAGVWGMIRHLGSSALGAVGWLMGHNPLAFAFAGEAAGLVGKEGAEATKLGLIRFLGSKEPISAPGFKAMVSYFNKVQKGQDVLENAVKNVLKPGAMVLAANAIPTLTDREKLDKNLSKIQNQPDVYANNQNTELGHYLPEHQQAMTASQTRITNYLQSLKPKTNLQGVLDTKYTTKADQQRYIQAQNIALNPNIVLDKIKKGTLKTTDMQDLNAMYPGLYGQMTQKLTSEMNKIVSENGTIPYKIRTSLSLFLAAPLDSTMQPASIQAAQMALMPQQPPQPQASGKSNKVTNKGGEALAKGAKAYRTPGQAAEDDRTDRK
jgi:hypothetical protein